MFNILKKNFSGQIESAPPRQFLELAKSPARSMPVICKLSKPEPGHIASLWPRSNISVPEAIIQGQVQKKKFLTGPCEFYQTVQPDQTGDYTYSLEPIEIIQTSQS